MTKKGICHKYIMRWHGVPTMAAKRTVRLVSLSSFYSFIWTNKKWPGVVMTCYAERLHMYKRVCRGWCVYILCVRAREVFRKPVTNEKLLLPLPTSPPSLQQTLPYFSTDRAHAEHYINFFFYPDSRSIQNVTLFFL